MPMAQMSTGEARNDDAGCPAAAAYDKTLEDSLIPRQQHTP